jgi:hypothetical protein
MNPNYPWLVLVFILGQYLSVWNGSGLFGANAVLPVGGDEPEDAG